MGLDRHLFVLGLDSGDVAGCGRFYKSVLAAWKLLRVSREWGMVPAQWVLEEPLFGNPLIALGGSVNAGLQERFVGAGICKLAHLRSPEGRGWKAPGSVAEKLGLHSVRTVERLMGKMVGAVPLSVQEQLDNLTPLVCGEDLIFPELQVSVAMDGWQERRGYILAFNAINLGRFEAVGKATMYGVCVKVRHLGELIDV